MAHLVSNVDKQLQERGNDSNNEHEIPPSKQVITGPQSCNTKSCRPSTLAQASASMSAGFRCTLPWSMFSAPPRWSQRPDDDGGGTGLRNVNSTSDEGMRGSSSFSRFQGCGGGSQDPPFAPRSRQQVRWQLPRSDYFSS
ncbi:hypothetical protein T484DRAFT_2289064 [Baffinella frigidus]|nr:hypothetical protein T484DRAFT_2289064 [Cryptophyta sp. CCMP2293]